MGMRPQAFDEGSLRRPPARCISPGVVPRASAGARRDGETRGKAQRKGRGWHRAARARPCPAADTLPRGRGPEGDRFAPDEFRARAGLDHRRQAGAAAGGEHLRQLLVEQRLVHARLLAVEHALAWASRRAWPSAPSAGTPPRTAWAARPCWRADPPWPALRLRQGVDVEGQRLGDGGIRPIVERGHDECQNRMNACGGLR
jgi:hypothetical protein